MSFKVVFIVIVLSKQTGVIMYKTLNVRVTEAEHEWMKSQRKKDVKFKQVDFMSDAITEAINKAKRISK